MSTLYTNDEKIQRFEGLLISADEIISEAADATIAELHEQLELATEFGHIRFIQGQIAGVRSFCTIRHE